MNDQSRRLYDSSALATVAVDDPRGWISARQKPVLSTPAVVAGLAIGYAMLNAFEAGRNGGPIRPAL
ncbi:hypothetical protein [Streptomyces radicis]|uniref:Uncharacterized protein n=1 Tax=Streptomyces radicis TaxID=1750517 RepID=A0A3A9WC47_9ACTN|nr:hypothetical protein [Streptomyces radicis]RKN10931.1 hypothetical protein D7319_07255 [Streptomyces radicis]RKN25194.1 hypothetical protein D7318_08110 [Streptomyces radicis]